MYLWNFDRDRFTPSVEQWTIPGRLQFVPEEKRVGSKMEYRGWEHDRSYDKGSLALVPPVLETLGDVYKHVLKFVSRFPLRKRLVLYFVFRGTSVKVDLGDAKAAGVVCVLGIGVGLGSLLFYKLYYNYLRPIWNQPDNKHFDDNSDIYADDDCCYYSGTPSQTHVRNTEACRLTSPCNYYHSNHGVATSYKKMSSKLDEILDRDAVRLRRKNRRLSSHNSDRDSAIGGASELGQSFYSEGINRDSFYSTCTAESGFENMDDSSSLGVGGDGFPLSRYPSLSQSLQVNFSPKSLNNKAARYAQIDNDEWCIDEPSGHAVNHCCVLEHKNNCEMSKSLDGLSPFQRHRSKSCNETTGRFPNSGCRNVDCQVLGFSPKCRMKCRSVDCDSCGPLVNYRSRSGSIGGWSWDSEDRDGMSPLPVIPLPPMTEVQFKQSLLQRLRDWSSLSVDEKSRSVTPEPFPALCSVRRSRSLDRSEGFMPDDAIFDNELIDFNSHTTENLEHIEGELQDIQDEFNMITSQLSDLIHKKEQTPNSEGQSATPEGEGQPAYSLSSNECHLTGRVQTRWERSPSISFSDSERSSREGSIELTWDLGDIGGDEIPHSKRYRRRYRLRGSMLRRTRSYPQETVRSSSCESSPLRSTGFQRQDTNISDLLSSNEVPVPTDDNQSKSASTDLKSQEPDPTTFCDDAASSNSSQPNPVKKNQQERLNNIGVKVDILSYSNKEWRGNTPRAETMRQGYATIPDKMNCTSMKQIRGDNYCAVRGALYQVLSQGHCISHSWPGIVDTVNKLHHLYQEPSSGLQQWTFANRLPCTDENRLARMCECVFTLYSTIEEVCKITSYETRAEYASDLLNSDLNTDLELMEGIKLLMALTSIDLHIASERGEDVPIFVWLMFARDSSQTDRDLIVNHLNVVGDSGGLEQVEMCLLGYTLGVEICVARLRNVHEEDFICRFPDYNDHVTRPVINLLAEDDRHYNVPIP